MRPDAPSVTFTVPGEPVSKLRPRHARSQHHCYTPSKTKHFEAAVCHAFPEQNPGRFSRDHPATRVDVHFRFGSRKHIDPINGRCAVLDGLTGVAYRNDNRVSGGETFEERCQHPSTIVTVR